MLWRQVLQWIGIALIACGCAAAAGSPEDVASRCAQTGGRWNAALTTCDRGAGGGGGY